MRKDAALLAVIIAALLVFGAAPAHAGTYDVVACNVAGAQGTNLAWTLEPYNSAGKAAPALTNFVVNGNDATTCTAAAGAQFSTAGAARSVKVDDGAAWTFRAPAGTNVKRVQIWRHGMARASADNPKTANVENGWWNVVARAGDGPGGRVLLSGEICSGALPAPTYCQTGAAFTAGSFTTLDVGEPVVAWGVQCAGTSITAYCFTGDGTTFHARFDLQAARVTVEDLVPPELAAGVPPLQRAGDAIAAAATDSAGIRSLRVLVDGAERFSERPDCDYRRAAPCPGSVAHAYDLSDLADGVHTVTTLAEDAASNLTRLERTVAVDSTAPVIDRVPVTRRTVSAFVGDALSGVRGGAIEVRANAKAPFTTLPTALRDGRLTARIPKSLSPEEVGIRVSATDAAGNAVTALVTSMSLSTRTGKHFRKVRHARARVPYGRAVELAGRLTTTDGVPIAHQAITVTGVLHQTGAAPQPVTTVVTDLAGRFRFAVPAGPSRTLTVAYAGNPGVLRRARTASLRVPARATIRAERTRVHGAATVRFSGRLKTLGATLPPGGKIVELQAAQRGRWTTVATTRATGPKARWRAVARFRGNPGRYPVRLRIRREAAFPYERGYSRAIPIRVR